MDLSGNGRAASSEDDRLGAVRARRAEPVPETEPARATAPRVAVTPGSLRSPVAVDGLEVATFTGAESPFAITGGRLVCKACGVGVPAPGGIIEAKTGTRHAAGCEIGALIAASPKPVLIRHGALS